MHVLVLGGYGNFGRIIARKLLQIPGIRVTIAGRRLALARVVAQELGCAAAAIDCNAIDLPALLRTIGADLLISTAGPFQGQDYHVARAALAADLHYIDIADARRFVCGITTLDAEARSRRRLVVSGASSVPALSGAVLDALAPQFSQLESVDFAISSSEKVPGVATLAAVLGYCGRPLPQWQGGQWRTVYGWQDMRRYGGRRLGRRWLGNCDIPDLELLPARYPSLQQVRFGAGTGLRLTQWGTWAFSWLVRAGWIKHPIDWAAPLQQAGQCLEWLGNGRSGMFVRVSGRDPQGQAIQRCWEILANQNDGINIPCMAAVALVRKLHRGNLLDEQQQPRSGALPCLGLLTLNEYLWELDGLAVEVESY